ncbi:MAG: ATP phosphoribosyltransferase regulatory subunit [Chloroflexota bacterium]
MKVQRYKGARDLSPAEMRKFRLLEGDFFDSCLRWGYEEVKTPVLEYLHLFTASGTLTPAKLSKVYSFLDWDGWSGERVVLRPDGTIPVARFYIDSLSAQKLARLFYISNFFIFEETGREARERWQGGAELLGASSPLGDVELVALALEILERLGFSDVVVRLSHAGLIRELLTQLGLSREEQTRVFHQILDGDSGALSRIEKERPGIKKELSLLLDLKVESSGFLKNLRSVFAQSLPQLKPAMDNFVEIVEQLESLGCRYQIDIGAGRGFEYYTGVIFKFYRGETIVGGGGRYDALVPLLGGKDTPACGFALYFDPLMSLLPSESPPRYSEGVAIATTAQALKPALELARYLRSSGYIAELDWDSASDRRWRLGLQEGKPGFQLTDRASQKTLVVSTREEVIALLGEKGEGQNSPP